MSGQVFAPPQAVEAEEALLGAILSAGALGLEVAERVTIAITKTGLEAGDFYRESHRNLYTRLIELVEAGVAPEIAIVAGHIEHDQDLLTQAKLIVACGHTYTNVAHYAEIIRAKACNRRLVATLGPVVEHARNGGLDPDKAREAIESASQLMQGGGSAASLKPLDLATVLAGPPPPVPWLWRGWLARGDLGLQVGDPGVGKSLLGLSLGDAIRRGACCLGEPCHKGRVAIFDWENPLDEAYKRLRGVGLTADDHCGLLYFHAPALDLGSREGQRLFADTLERQQIEFAIIDSLRRAAPSLDENDSAAVSALLSPLRALTLTTGRTILIIHHPRKRIGDNPSEASQMVRGSLDLVASVDTLLYLRAKGAGQFTLEQAKARRGLPHEAILVSITEADDDHIELVNAGPIAAADDKVEAMLERIVAALAEAGGPLERPVLAQRVGAGDRNSTFTRALKLGWQRDRLAKTSPAKVGDTTLYSLPPEAFA